MRRRTVLAAVGAVSAAALLPAGRASADALPPFLFVGAHPDDETLAMSVSFTEHLRAGQTGAWLCLTRGEASSVRTRLGLSIEAFGTARMLESNAAASSMASGYGGHLTRLEAHLPDGAVTVDAARDAILAAANALTSGPVRLKTHTHLGDLDLHPDHLAAGLAVEQLKADDPARFSDVRHYILPYVWDTPEATESGCWSDWPADTGVTSRVRAAVNQYKYVNVPAGRYGIGYKSTPVYFDQVYSTPRSVTHQ